MKNKISKILTAAVLAAFTTANAPLTYAEEVTESLPQLEIHFIDVGQGLAIMAKTEDEVLIYDGGNRDTSSIFVSYLMQYGINDIDYMIASHYDSDHLSGLIGALSAFETETVLGPDYVHGSKLYESFYSLVETQGNEVLHPEVGDTYEFGKGSFTVLGPVEIKNDSNNNSIVILLEYGEYSFLFTGDAEHYEEEDILDAGIDVSCDVLSVGHHGSATSTSWDFIEAALPGYAVISCGIDNSYGHPDEEILEKLESIEAQIFRTDEQGSIVVSTDGISLDWNVIPSNGMEMYAASRVNVREQPNTQCAVLGQLEAGEAVAVLAEEEGWATVAYNGMTAYVSMDFLTDYDSSAQAPSSQGTQEQAQNAQTPTEKTVWISETGSKYHSINNCGQMNPDNAHQTTETQAVEQGYEKCSKCW